MNFQISKREHLDILIAQASMLNLPHHIELLRAVRDGQIALVEGERQALAVTRFPKRLKRPVIQLIGDDDTHPTGPTGWTAWRRLGHWACAAMVHAAGGDAASYRLAIELALRHRRFLLIETDAAHADEWITALEQRNILTLAVLPTDGVHPLTPSVLQ